MAMRKIGPGGFEQVYACSKCGVVQVSGVASNECISCEREATFRRLLDLHLGALKFQSEVGRAAVNQIKALQEQVERVGNP